MNPNSPCGSPQQTHLYILPAEPIHAPRAAGHSRLRHPPPRAHGHSLPFPEHWRQARALQPSGPAATVPIATAAPRLPHPARQANSPPAGALALHRPRAASASGRVPGLPPRGEPEAGAQVPGRPPVPASSPHRALQGGSRTPLELVPDLVNIALKLLP